MQGGILRKCFSIQTRIVLFWCPAIYTSDKVKICKQACTYVTGRKGQRYPAIQRQSLEGGAILCESKHHKFAADLEAIQAIDSVLVWCRELSWPTHFCRHSKKMHSAAAQNHISPSTQGFGLSKGNDLTCSVSSINQTVTRIPQFIVIPEFTIDRPQQ